MPLVAKVYRGQNSDFSGFCVSPSGAQGPGIYLADRFTSASGYGSLVVDAELTLVNPFYFHPSEESLDAEINPELVIEVLGADQAQLVFDRIEAEGYFAYGLEVMNELRARGHDGIVMVYPFGEPALPGVAGEAVFIVFEPKSLRFVWCAPVPGAEAAHGRNL